MVIISVSRSKEKAMLKTVNVLRRLLRNAFFVTNRVKVIGELQRELGCKRQERPSPPRIDEERRYRQPVQFLPRSIPSHYLLSFERTDSQVEIVIRVG